MVQLKGNSDAPIHWRVQVMHFYPLDDAMNLKNTKYKPLKNKEWLTRILPDENSVLQCSAVLTGKELLTLREACCLCLQGIAHSTANPENEGHMLIWNVRKYSSVCTLPYPWKLHRHHTVRFLVLVILLSVLTCRPTFKMTTTNNKGKWIFH